MTSKWFQVEACYEWMGLAELFLGEGLGLFLHFLDVTHLTDSYNKEFAEKAQNIKKV